MHTHLEQRAANAAVPGEQLGVLCLVQGFHLSGGQFLPEPRFEPTYKACCCFVFKGDVGICMLAYLRWIFLISIARTACGCDYIRDNVLRQEKLGLSLVSFGLLYHRIFVFNKTYLI